MCTLTLYGEYDGSIFAAAAMWPPATIILATYSSSSSSHAVQYYTYIDTIEKSGAARSDKNINNLP